MKMSQLSKKEYLSKMRKRYQGVQFASKSRLIDEVCENLEVCRKHAIKLLNRSPKPPAKRVGRPPLYGSDERKVLEGIWRVAEQPCSKRFQALLPNWLPFYEVEEGKLPGKLKRNLLSMSPASIDRHMRPVRAQSLKGLTGTKPGSIIRSQIPIHKGPWDVDRAGYLEADTVAHCGGSMAGDFIWSICLTDIHVCWTELRATWNKGSAGVVEQIKNVENQLPYSILGFDSDNGSEFLNYHLVNYFLDRKPKVSFTRSRPYKKNDNAHVEQKNWTHVRGLLGYSRLGDPDLVEPINRLYQESWSLLHNFFLPSMKLVSKERIKSRTRRKYDHPQTPYDRLRRSRRGVKTQKLKELKDRYESLNPFELHRQVEANLKQILR
jgi:hypothetical protein